MLTITATPNSKTYDSQATAGAIPTASSLVGNDTVTGLTEAYADANAGTGKTVSITAYTIHDGNSGKNYAVTKVANTRGSSTKSHLPSRL